MLITPFERLVNRIKSCLIKKSKDELVVGYDAIVVYLHEFGLGVPPAQFRLYLDKMLKQELLDKGRSLEEPGIMNNIARAIAELALNMVAAIETTAAD